MNIDKHLVPHLGEMQLCDLRAADVQALVVEKSRSGLSWNTVRHLRNLLSRILRTAVEWTFINANPVRGVRLPPKQLSRIPVVLTIEQVRALLRTLPETERAMVLLCVFAGLRAGELFALRWRHIDLDRGVLHVRESVHMGKFGLPKTSSSVRDLPIGGVVLSALIRHRQRATASEQEDLVFPSTRGTALRRNNVLRRVLQPACRRANVPRITWHSLRHLHATLLSEAGQPLKVAQAQLGHADLQTTLGVYTHVLPDSQRRAVDQIEALVFPNFPKFESDGQMEGKVIQ